MLPASSFLAPRGRPRVFLPFDDFPWFKSAPVEAIIRLERPALGHLHRPALDVDLSIASIEHPERYPLRAKS
ncbi:MAG TPA: DUF2442 domain-containing protein [Thermoleophilaceae bacterium]|jgi:hypothetical protein